MIIFMYLSSRLTVKDNLVILLLLAALIIYALFGIYNTNILSVNMYVFLTYNLHYYLILLGELAFTLVFKLIKK